MAEIVTIGLDIAKSVFQVHGVDAAGQVVVRRRLRRSHVLRFFAGLAPCMVGIEACATSHHWSRQLQALGHSVKLMPPSYVKPYVKRQKNDMADAEAICEAVMRPTMRFVETKTPEHARAIVEPQTALLWLLLRHFQPLPSPDPPHTLDVHTPAFVGQPSPDPSIAVASVPRCQSLDRRRSAPPRHRGRGRASLRRPRLADAPRTCDAPTPSARP